MSSENQTKYLESEISWRKKSRQAWLKKREAKVKAAGKQSLAVQSLEGC